MTHRAQVPWQLSPSQALYHTGEIIADEFGLGSSSAAQPALSGPTELHYHDPEMRGWEVTTKRKTKAHDDVD